MESPTENIAIELLEPIVLRKENCAPIEFEQGTILKVLLVNWTVPGLSETFLFKLGHLT